VRTYTISEAADLTGLTRKAVARRIERGSLRSVVRNGRRRIPRSELVRAGLLDELDSAHIEEFDPSALLPRALPVDDPDAPPLRPDETLAAVFRELLDRFERQAAEIAQFRALTVQAESLRMASEIAELRVRLAELEQPQQRELPPASGELGQRLNELSERVEDLTKREIWLPPQAQSRRAAHEERKRRPDPEVAALAQRLGELEHGRARRRLASRRGLRLAGEAALIIAAALAAWWAQLSWPAIAAVMAITWVAVAVVEWASWRRGG
jgi:excisionase family DNA binding protein